MKVGTKSVLFGAHCFLLHPWFVFAAWWKLYGFPFDPRLWVAFFVHDLGYYGKPNMDGAEGELHPLWGAKVMHKLFDPVKVRQSSYFGARVTRIYPDYWYNFCLYHSRFLAKQNKRQYSQLCVADKLSICLEPSWLYLPRVNWSGEINEYMKNADNGKYATMRIPTKSQKEWFKGVQIYLKRWVEEHKDGKFDSWTPETKQAINAEGVWK